MGKKLYKKFTKKIIKAMDLLKDLQMLLLNFSFVVIYVIHKMLVLLKNHLNFLNVVFSNAFLRSKIDF